MSLEGAKFSLGCMCWMLGREPAQAADHGVIAGRVVSNWSLSVFIQRLLLIGANLHQLNVPARLAMSHRIDTNGETCTPMYSPDGQRLAIVCRNSVKIWQLSTVTMRYAALPGSKPVAWSFSGDFVVFPALDHPTL